MSASAPAARELLDELRSLWARLPVPDGTWHAHVQLIRACRADLERALELAAGDPHTLELLAALVEGDVDLEFRPDASRALAAAWQRLEALPRPQGQHPYLDDILPALEALRLLLVALGHRRAA